MPFMRAPPARRSCLGGGGKRTFCLGPHSEFNLITSSDFGGGGNGGEAPNPRVGTPTISAEGDSEGISMSPNFGEMLRRRESKAVFQVALRCAIVQPSAGRPLTQVILPAKWLAMSEPCGSRKRSAR